MREIEAVVAVYQDWGIGAGGTQPVALKADRRFFRELTRGSAVIVGRRTLEDFPGGRPLPGRENIVLTRRDIIIDGAKVAHSPEEAVEDVESERVFVIGGASVYKAMLPYVQRVYVTKIGARPVSDSFFPDLDADPGWRETNPGELMEEGGVPYRFAVYERTEQSGRETE